MAFDAWQFDSVLDSHDAWQFDSALDAHDQWSFITGTVTITDFPVAYGARRVRSGGTGNINLSGAYTGGPTSIQARARNYTTDAVVKDWTTITGATISGGAWSGTLEEITASSAWLKIDVRFGNATQIASDATTNQISIGWTRFMYGQSLYERVSIDIDPAGTDTAHASTRQFHRYLTTGELPDGDGAISYCNKMQSELDMTVVLINRAYGGAPLQEGSPFEDSFGSLLTTDGDHWPEVITMLSDIADNDINEFSFSHGHADALSGSWGYYSDGKINTDYKTALETLIANVRALTRSDLPVFLQPTERADSGVDDDRETPSHKFQPIREAMIAIANEQANTYFGKTGVDLPNIDEYHFTEASFKEKALREALDSLWLYDSTTYANHSEPRILYFKKTASDTLRVTIEHDGGTDFVPTSSITGFEAHDGSGNLVGGGEPTGARVDATHIDLTFPSALPAPLTLHYLYDQAPNITAPVYDNITTLGLSRLPLQARSNIPDKTDRPRLVL